MLSFLGVAGGGETAAANVPCSASPGGRGGSVPLMARELGAAARQCSE